MCALRWAWITDFTQASSFEPSAAALCLFQPTQVAKAMPNGFLQHEATIRLGVFASLFALMALWELAAPAREHSLTRQRRWMGNLGLSVINTLVLRLVAPMGLVGVATWGAAQQMGLFNAVLHDLPVWAAHHLGLSPFQTALGTLVLTLLLLDLIIYAQHVTMHRVPILWRLHRVHHADQGMDVTTGARFHTLEIILSFGLKSVAVLALGASPLAVVLFELILSSTALFNHGNVSLPKRVDTLLRWFVVTPDMHRIHHHIEPQDTNSNYGFNIALWDRLFGTYRPVALGEPALGLKEYTDPQVSNRLLNMLKIPFGR